MAIIYDISTGRVISASVVARPAETRVRHSAYTPLPQPLPATRAIETEQRCTAYMALLQHILKDL
jgi:hypothetical protein